MTLYQHILLAVDFFEQDNVVVNRALDLAAGCQARLSLIHVVDSLPIVDTGLGMDIPYPLDLADELTEVAKSRLAHLANRLGVAESDTWLVTGSPKLEIIRIANEQRVDLIVLGSHGRHGLALLLGSTANSILHHAQCDVLAVRLPNTD